MTRSSITRSTRRSTERARSRANMPSRARVAGLVLLVAWIVGVPSVPAQTGAVQTGQVEACGGTDTVAGTRCPQAQMCRILDNNTGYTLAPNAHGDPLFEVLSQQRFCPENALQFRDLLKRKYDLQLQAGMVANRGYHNPLPAGSFSFFEAVTGDFEDQTLEFGDFYFGHFTAASTDETALTSILAPQQAGTPDNLLLESVVWDPRKGYYNFYEIRGTGEGGVWFYRGDTRDILLDTRNLDRNFVPSELQFGEVSTGGAHLRCSGCHMNGGPLMKELSFPHDSWWRKKRPLPLGAMRIAPDLVPLLAEVADANDFATWVKAGYHKLFDSESFQTLRSQLTWQEQLRPLFCEQEVNLASDTEPFERPTFQGIDDQGVVRAPIGFFVDPRLLPEDRWHVVIDYTLYYNALVQFDSLFLDYQAGGARPTDSKDGDHAFESPVKSYSDMLLIEKMIEAGTIDEEFVLDVLAVDMTQPMFSDARCSLMRLLPTSGGDGWLEAFKEALAASHWPSAAELLVYLDDPRYDGAYHRARAEALVDRVQTHAARQEAVTGYVRLLAQRRIAVFQDQISQHPQGQIFEPDFRLIFPTFQLLKKDQNEIAYGGVPFQYWLNPRSGLVELAPPVKVSPRILSMHASQTKEAY